MVVIIDDREDVWNYAPNLIHVRPYHFFQHTGDINAPPGLAKQEKDEKEGFDFTSLNEKATDVPEDVEKESNQQMAPEEKAEDGGSTTVISTEGSLANNGMHADVLRNEDKQKIVESSQSEEDQHNSSSNQDGQEKKNDNLAQIEILPEKQSVPQLDDSTAEAQKNDVAENFSGKIDSKIDDNLRYNSLQNKIHIQDTDDYLLHLQVRISKMSCFCCILTAFKIDVCMFFFQDILRTIHEAYFEMYDDHLKKGSQAVPDMKFVLPYVRRKVLLNVRIVFSGVVRD